MDINLPANLILNGVHVGRLHGRITPEGQPQFIIEGVNNKEAITVGGNRDPSDVQVGPDAAYWPRVTFATTRPNGSSGDVRLRANVTVATDEFNDMLPADPAGCVNIYRDLHHRPEESGSQMRFFGRTDNGLTYEFLRILQLRHGSQQLRAGLGLRGTDSPDIMFDYGPDWIKIVFLLPNGRVSKLSVDNDGGLKYEAYTGKVTTLATP